MHSIDTVIQHYISAMRTPALTEYMYLVTVLFDVTWVTVLLSCIVALLVYLFRGARYALLFLVTMSVGALAVVLLKYAFNIARPVGGVLDTFGASFPSYHAAIATICFVMLMYVFDTYFARLGRIVFNTLCVAAILLVAGSRIYLGVHWASDVLGGIILGGVLAYVSTRLFQWYTDKSHV